MNADEFRTALGTLGLSQVDLARLVKVSVRAVNMWAVSEREVPGPVTAYLRLLLSMPAALQLKEFSRLGGDIMTIEGMYSVEFAGVAGKGLAALILEKGRVYGSDGEVKYDGTYQPNAKPGYVDLLVTARVPPNTQLVQGYPKQPVPFKFDLTCTFQPGSNQTVSVNTQLGLVSANIKYMRAIPA